MKPDRSPAVGQGRNPEVLICRDESRTIQAHLPMTRISNILRQYNATGGIIDHLNQAQATYADVSEFTDLKDALLQANQAKADFMRMSPEARAIFNHDVAEWLDTAHDPLKRRELMDRGLLEDPEKKIEPASPVMNEPPAPDAE